MQMDATHEGGGHHFVLVHGASHGAWCWYKIITLLQQYGNEVSTIDLTSNGISKKAANQVTSISQYVQPLTDFLENYITSDNKKAIIVGHSLGGSSVTYCMERFADKISKAIFIAANMPSNGQNFVPVDDLQAMSPLFEGGIFCVQFFEGSSIPTSIIANLAKLKEFLYNNCPPEDTNLARALLNPTPYAPLSEKLFLTQDNYGSIKRYYIKTTLDRIIEPSLQESIIERNPPNEVFTINNSDHSPFFSQPKALANLLLLIASR